MRHNLKVLLSGVAMAGLTAGAALAADTAMAPVMAAAPMAAPAAPHPGGVLSLYGGLGNINVGGDLYRILGFDGAFVIPIGNMMVQIGGVGEIGIEAGADTYAGVGMEAHLLMRANNAVYGLAGTLLFDQNDDDWNIHGGIAAEAGMMRGGMTFGVQAGYLGLLATEGNDRLDHAWWLRSTASAMLGSRVRLSGDLAFYRGGFDSDNDPFRAIGFGAEAAFMVGPHTAVFMSYDGLWHQDLAWGGTYLTHTVLGGIRVMIGDAHPTMNLPDFGRINAIMGENN